MGGFGGNCRLGSVLFFSCWITLAALSRLLRPAPNGCQMTYMYPTYIPISTPKNVSSDRYGLFLLFCSACHSLFIVIFFFIVVCGLIFFL